VILALESPNLVLRLKKIWKKKFGGLKYEFWEGSEVYLEI
jgi:hypothetical protein